MASFSRILAVDVGATALRLAEIGIDGRGRPTVLALSEEEIAFDPAKTPEFLPMAIQALTAGLGRISSKTRACVLCLGGPAVFARILKVPAADPGKVRSMIGFEAQQAVPAIEQAWWDCQVLPSPQPGEFEALILAIKKDTVEEISAAAAAAGLEPQAVTLVPAAVLNTFFFNHPEATGCNLILEIGARATTILLVEGPRLFVRVVPLGGAAVSQAVATDLQESFAGAELLKRAKGFVHPGGAYEDPADAAAARASKLARGVMTRMLTEVERSVTFFRSQQGGGKPTQAWLAGGGARLGHTDLFFREKLRIPVDFLQPFRRLALAPQVEAGWVSQNFPAWGTAVGAALEALPDVPVRINVLGSVGGGAARKSRDRAARTMAGLAVTALLLLPGLHGFWQAAKTGIQLTAETERVEEASRALQRLEAENRKMTATLQRLELAASLEEERLRWPRLLHELKQHCPERLWITRLEVRPAAENAPGVDRAPSVVEIGGMFETKSAEADAEAVANFQKALEAGGVLRNVTVLERETPQYVDGKTDQVALKFRLQADWPEVLPETKPAPRGEK